MSFKKELHDFDIPDGAEHALSGGALNEVHPVSVIEYSGLVALKNLIITDAVLNRGLEDHKPVEDALLRAFQVLVDAAENPTLPVVIPRPSSDLI